MKRFFLYSQTILTLLFVTGLFVCLQGGGQAVYAQATSAKILPSPKPKASPAPKEVAQSKDALSLDMVFKALRSDKTTQAEKNQLLIRGVRERGVTFILTADVEEELTEQGASKTLLEAIRRETGKVQETPTFYRNRGDDFRYQGKFNEAIASYTKTIEMDPMDRAAYNNRGRTFEELKRYDEAYADFTKVIEIDPTDRNGYHNRGVIYYIRKEYQKAIADYTKAIELDPTFREAYLHRANAYQIMGQRDLAEADRQKAKELEQSKSF